MANRDKANKAVEGFARATRDSYERVLDHAVAMQERNVRFAREMADDSFAELREQAESNRAMEWDLAERAEKQRDAFRKVVEESLDAYMDFAFAPLSYYKQGLAVAGKVAK